MPSSPREVGGAGLVADALTDGQALLEALEGLLAVSRRRGGGALCLTEVLHRPSCSAPTPARGGSGDQRLVANLAGQRLRRLAASQRRGVLPGEPVEAGELVQADGRAFFVADVVLPNRQSLVGLCDCFWILALVLLEA